MVSEAGASIYSASDIAREEFPELDLTMRGAISIARRLQDPLAELVKIDPEEHRRRPVPARRQSVGAEKVARCGGRSRASTTSASISTPPPGRSSPTSPASANRWRQASSATATSNGPFASRKGLLKVPRFGAKAFEQAAGFLRIRGGGNPLDNTAVHPGALPAGGTDGRRSRRARWRSWPPTRSAGRTASI